MARPVRSLIRERDETRKTDHDARAFGLERAEPFDFDGFALIDLRPPSSPFELKLTVNKDQAKDDDLWNGYGHLAVVGDETWTPGPRTSRPRVTTAAGHGRGGAEHPHA